MEEPGKVLPLPVAPDAIELRHLRSFVAVATELNFGRAASRLYLSQPALSRQIRALERLVGCDLLRRSTHRVELTLAGAALLDRATKLLGDVDDAVSVTRAVGGELSSKVARIWQSVSDSWQADGSLQNLRDLAESMVAQFAPPPEVGLRPVNSGGVPSLVVAVEPAAPPTMLLLHGGMYVMGSAYGYRHLAGALAVAADSGVLVPDYRLAPEHPYPAAVEDAIRAYLWMIDGGVPPERIMFTGDSCGGGFVVSLLAHLTAQELPLPGGAALLCPAADLTGQTWGSDVAEEFPPPISAAQSRDLAALYLDGRPFDDPLISPLHADLTGMPPMLIQAATDDALLPDAHLLADRARAHGVDVRLDVFPVGVHVFHLFWSFHPEAAAALEQVGEFAKTVRTTATAQQGGS